MRALALVGDGDDDQYIGVAAVGDECLGAIEDVAIAALLRRGAGVARVGAGAWLSEGPGSKPITGGEMRKIFLLLLFGPGEEDVVGSERVVRGDREADRSVDGREFLDGKNVINVAETGAAISGRDDDAQQTHAGKFLDHFEGELARFVPGRDVRRDFARGEGANFAAKVLLVFSEDEGVEGCGGFDCGCHLRPPLGSSGAQFCCAYSVGCQAIRTNQVCSTPGLKRGTSGLSAQAARAAMRILRVCAGSMMASIQRRAAP